ncbi:DUF6537 domain-containing protein [Caulobacter segnis]
MRSPVSIRTAGSRPSWPGPSRAARPRSVSRRRCWPPRGQDGKPKKIAFGGWMLDVAFPLMARMKGLRGGALDLFGHARSARWSAA